MDRKGGIKWKSDYLATYLDLQIHTRVDNLTAILIPCDIWLFDGRDWLMQPRQLDYPLLYNNLINNSFLHINYIVRSRY